MVAKLRKFADYRCLGAGCGAQVRLRVTQRGPKTKPPIWLMVRARYHEAADGTLREASLLFCTRACLENPDQTDTLGRTTHTYLGPPGEPPATVTYRCLVCEMELPLPISKAVGKACMPPGWESVPLIAHDYETGIARLTNLPVCGTGCIKALAAATETPDRALRESQRLLEGITVAGGKAFVGNQSRAAAAAPPA